MSLNALKFAQSPRFILFSLLALLVLRVCAVFVVPVPLQVDEAQYAGWGHALAAGYYSKPPFVAWALALGQWLAGVLHVVNVEATTRMLQAPILALVSVLIACTTWQLFKDRWLSLVSALVFMLLPWVGFYSFFAATDAYLLLWWSVALTAFVIALQQPGKTWPWLVLGVAIGLGMLSKYAMLFFVVCAGVALWRLRRELPVSWTKPALALFVATLVFAPNIIWNAHAGFPTFHHHLDISHVDTVAKGAWTWRHGVESVLSFSLSQLLIGGPWVWATLLFLVLRKKITLNLVPQEQTGLRLITSFIWPMLALIMLQAWLTRANANWALAIYLGAVIVVALLWVRGIQSAQATLKRQARIAIVVTVLIGLLVNIFIVTVPVLLQNNPVWKTAKWNPLRKMQGWKETSLWARQRLERRPMPVIANDRKLLAALSTYGYPQTFPPLAWNPSRRKDNHYEWFYDLANAKNKQAPMLFIYVAPNDVGLQASLTQQFAQVAAIHDAQLGALHVGSSKFNVYAFDVAGFKGY